MFSNAHQEPISTHHNGELEDIDDVKEEHSNTDHENLNKPLKVSDERSHSSATNDPLTTSVSNNLSPSSQDSPLPYESNQEVYMNNNFFSDEKLEQNNDNDHLFDLTPDQQQAFRELELRKQSAEYDDDYDFTLNYDQVPEYDVREKLQSLNAQLANEPLPPDAEHRNSKVVFRDEIVSLVAPADDYDQSESELEDPSYNTDLSATNPAEIENETTSQSSPRLSDSGTVQPVTAQSSANVNGGVKNEETDVNQETPESQSSVIVDNNHTEINNSDKEKDSMVVSRGGEFHFLESSDIIDETNRAPKTDSDDGEHKRAKNRPISAPVSKRHNKDNLSNLDSGSSTKSDAYSRSNSLIQKQNERSKLQIPRVDKEALRRQQERKKKEEEENQRREEEEQTNRKEKNVKSFNAWLQTKQKHRKEDEDRKKKEEEEEKEKKEKQQDERRIIAEEKEKELTKKLENEKRKEEKLRQYRLKEMEESMIVHSKAECQKAFKDWLRKKHKDHQNKAREERQRARITRLAMRQCRKSQDLAQAIHQSSSFRYLDFCGYP